MSDQLIRAMTAFVRREDGFTAQQYGLGLVLLLTGGLALLALLDADDQRLLPAGATGHIVTYPDEGPVCRSARAPYGRPHRSGLVRNLRAASSSASRDAEGEPGA
jgi:hypothetical protein